MLRHTFLLLCCALLPFGLSAQDDDNFYRLELGGGVGIGFGLNDVNSKFYGRIVGALSAQSAYGDKIGR